ncbi:LigA protein [Amycolatopsis methanolica 239]|uniref:LigA protein n=1 Tax=Amycolatopsis methanolica 239 TaxID=1068978 RepID=A0A076N2J8_AMYME|nr:LigA protein [Amycolatopsis methanolica 239]
MTSGEPAPLEAYRPQIVASCGCRPNASLSRRARAVMRCFQEVGRALSDRTRTLEQLAAAHETPKGNNERIRTTWFTPANAAALTGALDDLLADLGGS